MIAAAISEALRRARRAGVVAYVSLTPTDTDRLLEEMGTKRDRRCTRRPAVDRFDGVPVYPDRGVSMVIYASRDDGQAYHVLL